MTDLMQAVAESYRETGELKLTAAEFGISALKVRKLLITAQAKGIFAGVYTSEIFSYQSYVRMQEANLPVLIDIFETNTGVK